MKKILLLFFIISFAQKVSAEKVYVFIPSTSSPKVIKQKLSTKVSGEILTFSKLKDFLKKVKQDKPEAIITREAVLQELPEYDVTLKGIYKEESSQQFYAVNLTGAFTPITTSKIGAVDFLGGKKMKDITSTVVGTPTKIKKVKKFKDLLPLLTMNMVDAVIVAESELEVLKRSSSQNLQETKMPNGIEGYVVFASSSPTTKSEDELKTLTKNDNLSMGVESWK